MRVEGAGFRVQGSGFGVEGQGTRVEGHLVLELGHLHLETLHLRPTSLGHLPSSDESEDANTFNNLPRSLEVCATQHLHRTAGTFTTPNTS